MKTLNQRSKSRILTAIDDDKQKLLPATKSKTEKGSEISSTMRNSHYIEIIRAQNKNKLSKFHINRITVASVEKTEQKKRKSNCEE